MNPKAYLAILRGFVVRVWKWIVLALLAMVVAGVAFVGYVIIAHTQSLELPPPTGPYPVGRIEYDWVDASRPDSLADSGTSPRELVVWVWYPAAAKGTTPAPYLPPAWVEARAKNQGIGVVIEHDLGKIQTHAFEDVALAAPPAAFPVLIMEPGMGPIVTDYTILAENLASHGYVVVGINPTYTANWTVFPDGRVALRSSKGVIPDVATLADAAEDAVRIEAVWAQDERFAMDQLARLDADPSSLFGDRLDLERIGVWGHSFGGAAAIAVCQMDMRCKASVDIDGTPPPGELQAPVPVPLMFITEDNGDRCDQNCQPMRQVYAQAQPRSAYYLAVAGAGHFNFSDLPFRQLPPFRILFALAGYEGTIQPTRALQITNAYLLAFFDQYLTGDLSDLMRGPSPIYPEVSYESR